MKLSSINLDLPSAPERTRVVVAMSGGVDSSVTAALVAEAGYEVIGVTLQLYDHGKMIQKKGACCAGADIYDARKVANLLEIPHYVLDYENRFKEAVIDDFANSYLRGDTPIPCVRCNQTVKFHDLLSTAKDLGADALCTGHYVQRKLGPFGPELHRAADLSKDQSYFLFATTAQQLEYLRFPLGHMSKKETRLQAHRFGLDIADKPDSQDICFVPQGRYADVVKRLRPGAMDPGEIVDTRGNQLGDHDGIINYTVGQRKGLGIGGRRNINNENETEPLYVISLDAELRRVVVGPKSDLARDVIELDELNWLGDGPMPAGDVDVSVKLRSTQEPVPARLQRKLGLNARLRLKSPQYGIATGQAAVFYGSGNEKRVLGGGWITKTDLKIG